MSNIVQENIELKKQNQDLKKVVQGLTYIKEIHLTLIEKCKKSARVNETQRMQL